MRQVYQYYQGFESARGRLTGLPSWGRSIVLLFALPGIALIALSILALGVSILALLLLTVPVYSLLRTLTRPREAADRTAEAVPSTAAGPFDLFGSDPTPGAKRVEATVIESGTGDAAGR